MDGLFVKSFLTVTAGPRVWPHAVERSGSMERKRLQDVDSLRQVRTSGGEEFSDGIRPYPPISRRRTSQANDDACRDPDKKKEKKWSLGGLFRRRKKDESDSSSQEEGNAPRKGFLARRRSRREKRKQRNSKLVGTFDHIVINPLTQPQNIKPNTPSNMTVNDLKLPNITAVSDIPLGSVISNVGSRVRGSRDSSVGGSIDRLSSRSSHESLQQRQARQETNLTRNSSEGSGSLEGATRRGRKCIMARVEALRDRQRGDSSSEEGDCFVNSHASAVPRFKSDDSLVTLQREGSFNRRSRVARTERYIKRLSRDEESILKKEAEMDPLQRQRLCKSDAEGSFGKSRTGTKGCSNGKWAVSVAHRECADYEPRAYGRKSSASPSPAQSPLIRPKNIPHRTPSAPSSSTYESSVSTFPTNNSLQTNMTSSLDRKVPHQPLNLRVSNIHPVRIASPLPSSKSSETVSCQGLKNRFDYSMKRPAENSSYKLSSGCNSELSLPGQRSISYDNNIHRPSQLCNRPSSPSTVTDEVMVVQFPVARLASFQNKNLSCTTPLGKGNNLSPSCFVAIKQSPPPPPPRDPQRKLFSPPNVQQDNSRPMSYAFENNSHQAPHQQLKDYSNRGMNQDQKVSNGQLASPQHQYSSISKANEVGIPCISSQKRSNSDDHIESQFFLNSQGIRPLSYSHSSRPRPSSVTPEAMIPRSQPSSSPPQQQPLNQKRFISRTPDIQSVSKLQTSCIPQLQYFADQHPRSRRPIHIQCNNSKMSGHDQPYLSDSQVVMKPPHQDRRNPVLHATDFWRQREQEGVVKQRKLHIASPKPPLQTVSRSDRSRSNSPHPKDRQPDHVISPESIRGKTAKFKIPPISFPVRPADSQSSLSGQSDISSSLPTTSSRFHSEMSTYDTCESSSAQSGDSLRKKDNSLFRPLSMVLENSESQDQASKSETNEKIGKSIAFVQDTQSNHQLKKEPPTPPTRRFSRQNSNSSLEAIEWMSEEGSEGSKKKRRSTNLDDALTELEAIYKSLRLGDEDLLDRAERRDLPTIHQQGDDVNDVMAYNSFSYRGAESDSGFNYGLVSSSAESLYGSDTPIRRHRAPPLRRSGIPDKVTDDMAFRRLNPKEKSGSQDIRNVVSQAGSYLLVSPVLGQSASSETNFSGLEQKSINVAPKQEPDTTYDDVVYRNIRHTNNALKVIDPQPPFGIPLGPVTAAPNSDYLHATPEDKYRPTFKPRKSPDVVKDDLAFRNLRKDQQKDPVLFPIDDLNTFLITVNSSVNQKADSNFSLRKKRAVRSLSANLQNIVRKEPLSLSINDCDQDFEKAQSLSDLPEALQVAQKILEGKDVIGGGTVKFRNLSLTSGVSSENNRLGSDLEGSSEITSQGVRRHSSNPTSWLERAHLNDRLSLCTGTNTSTETLTDSRANLLQESLNKRSSWQQKLRVFIPPVSSNESTIQLQRYTPPITQERKLSRPPLDFNKHKSSIAPIPITDNPLTLGPSLPVPETIPGSPLDEGQLEELLSALAREAQVTSETLGRELKELAQDAINLPYLKDSISKQVNETSIEKPNVEQNGFIVNSTKNNSDSSLPINQLSECLKQTRKNLEFKETQSIQQQRDQQIKQIEDNNLVGRDSELQEKQQNMQELKMIELDEIDQRKHKLVEMELQQLAATEERLTSLLDDTAPTLDGLKQNLKEFVESSRTFNNNSGEISTYDNVNETMENIPTKELDTNKTADTSFKEQQCDQHTKEENPIGINETVSEEAEDKNKERCDTVPSKEEPYCCVQSKDPSSSQADPTKSDTDADALPQQCRGSEDDSDRPRDSAQRRHRETNEDTRPHQRAMSDRRALLSSRAGVGAEDTSCSSDGGGEEAAAERIARYKEERRRQMAAQFGSRTEEGVPRRYITRNGGGGVSDHSTLSVRTTRTSRLRAAGVSPTESSHGSVSPGKEGSSPRRKELSVSRSAASSPSTPSVHMNGAGSGAATRARRVGVVEPLQRRRNNAATTSSDKEKISVPSSESSTKSSSAKQEKDKSSKRKSNLNCSSTTEKVVTNDLIGEVVARRRRHGPDHPVSLPISLHAVSSTSHALRSISDTGQSYLHANRATHPNKSLDNSSPRKSKEENPETASDSRLKSIGLKSLGINGNGVEKSGSNIGRKKSEAMLDREGNNSLQRKISSPLRGHRREPCPSPTSPEPTWNINSKTELRELRIVEDTDTSREINTNNNVSERSNLFNSTNSSIVNKHNILALEKSPSQSPEHKIRCLPTVAHYSSLANHSMKNGKRETSRSCSGSPVRHPSSILKKKSLDESHTVSKPVASQLPNHNNHMPVSILKRKTSKDEAVSSSPVTFSPSVIEPTSSRSKKQGILKKRASLDESEVMRRRSCSPDIANFGTDEGSDFKPILRYHRRSSLEELVRRTQSPDPHPHSILKRKTSREDGEIEDRTSCSPEPQGILKRKSFTGSSNCGNSNSPHVSIAASVIAAAAGIDPTDVFDNSEHMRPILKKKSSSEDSGTTDLMSEVPRPILKKKPSIEMEELDDRPKKPILKISSRKSSQEEREVDSVGRHVLLRGRSLGTDSLSGSDCDIMKPILKQPSIENVQSRERSSSPRPRLSFCDNKGLISSESALPGSPTFEGVALRRRQRPASIVGVVRSNSAAADSELTTILSKRRSLEYNHPPNLDGDEKGNVLSSKSAKIDLERPISPEGTRVERRLSVAERILTMESFFLEGSPPSTGAVPKQKAFHRDGKNKERFCTQPITMDEIQAFTRSESHQAFQKGILEIKSSMSNGLDIVSPSSVRSETQSSDVFSPASENSLLSSAEKVEGDVEAVLTAKAMECERDDSEEKGSGLSRSNSVVAKASLFNQLEEQMKLSAEESKSRRLPTRRAARFRDRKEEGNRFATQPVTSDEVQEAVRQSTSALEENKDEEKADEDDPSKYSLAERVRLFNQKIMEERLLKVPEGLVQRPLARKQVVSTRFKTAPVITEDVESARRISPLAASMSNPLNPKLSGSLSAKAVKEKIYEQASKILSKSGSTSCLPVDKKNCDFSQSSSDDVKPKGILKNTRDPDSLRSVPAEPSSPCDDNSDEESENEMRGILKASATPPPGTQTPELESFRHLKSVLKKETSAMSGKKMHTRKTLPKTNDPLRSILKPESKDWSTGEAPSTSEDSESGSGLSGEETKPAVHLSGKTTRSGSGVDIVSILHNVEAHAKQQRQANNKINLVKEEKAMNKKNLSQEKENQKYTYQKNKATEIKTEITKKAVRDKLVGAEHRCSVHRKIESKQLSIEAKLSRKVVECPYGLKVVSNEKQKIGGVPESYEEKLRRQLDNQSSTNETTPPTSDGETSSSGGREVRRIIRNEAGVQRRKPVNKYHKERSTVPNQQELVKSKSTSVVASVVKEQSQVCKASSGSERDSHAVEGGFVRGGLQRSFTQPCTDLELKEQEEVMSGGTIAERLAKLRQRDSDWEKRNSRINPEDDLNIITAANNHLNELQDVSDQDRDSSILADRLEKLDQARQGWKKRVEPTDAVRFSVAGKMGLENKADTPPLATFSPADRKKRTPKQRRFRSSLSQRQEVASTPSSPQKELIPSFIRSISAPGGDDNDLSSVGQEAACNGMKVLVPRADDETFTAFFRSISSEHQVHQECVEIKDEDLDHVISKSSQLLVYKRNVKIHRRHAGTRNPIKALASRTDIQDEYMEIQTGLAEKELRRIQVEKLSKNCNFAVEALAGLASKEDFTAVALKKASPSSAIMLPYKDVMLLHVKGRRHVQTRLVEPAVTSVNRGDSYVLVAPGQVYHWVGKYSNVIERSRGAEVALHIQQKKDLGCSGASSVITLGEEKTAGFNSSHSANFWRLLGGDESSKAVEAGHPDEDELYESCLIDTNMVFEVVNDELVPVEEYWGTIPKIKMLDPSKILVFDYGSELYVWSGKTAPLDQRRVAKRLAQELWEDGYDYSDCDVCPLSVTELLGANRTGSTVSKQSSTRPPWALLAKVTQHMETILFREKFLDWPDFTRVIRIKGCDDEDKQTDASMDLKPCDAKLMLEPNLTEPDMELEGNHLGRGTKYFDEETHRHYEITTQSVTMWHILEFEYTQLPQISLGQFHSGDSYVVRWRYVVTVTGRELNGQPSRHSAVGRDRCAYFCWQGSDASLNEQGAAALLTVELDEELGPQVRVVQGAEHPVFLHLFQGSMVIHSGKREGSDPYQRKGWRLYICQGNEKEEAALVQVQCSGRSLRSRSSLVLVNSSRGTVFVWHGAKTCAHTKKIAMSSAEQLKKRPIEMEFPSEVDIVISELNEGSESKDFFKALGGNNRHLYVSLRHERGSYTHTPRMFHLGSLSGTFLATEVLCPHRKTEIPVPYPFLQADLYSASQPALFLLDNHHELWLWQGWWPAHNEESDGDNKNLRGSRAVLWQAERRAAMQTALDYWGLKHGNSRPRAYLVWAGLEPLAFTNLFPIWSDRDDIAELNISDGKKPGELLSVEAELARLTRSTYPAAQLLQRPLPDGVDPTRLEFYLDPNHFQELLGMTKEEFFELPTWKQTNLKKDVGLF